MQTRIRLLADVVWAMFVVKKFSIVKDKKLSTKVWVCLTISGWQTGSVKEKPNPGLTHKSYFANKKGMLDWKCHLLDVLVNYFVFAQKEGTYLHQFWQIMGLSKTTLSLGVVHKLRWQVFAFFDYLNPSTVCWIEFKLAVLCAHLYMPGNLLLIKV